MADVDTWSPLDESNTSPPPDGWPEFMLPSGVNNSGRAMMGAIRRWYDKTLSGDLVLPYLKTNGGGTVTGAVTVSGTLTATAMSCTTTIYSASTISTGAALSAGGAVSGASVSASGNIGGGSFSTTGGLTVNGNGTFAGGTGATQVGIYGNGIAYFGSNQIAYTWTDARVQVWVDRIRQGHIAIADDNNNLTLNGFYGNYLHSNYNIDAGGTMNAGAFNTGGGMSSGSVSTGNVNTSQGIYYSRVGGGRIEMNWGGEGWGGYRAWADQGNQRWLVSSGSGAQRLEIESSLVVYRDNSSFFWTSWDGSASDRRLKRDIEPAGDALTLINAIPVHSAMVRDEVDHDKETHWQFAFITDELEERLPMAVHYPPHEDGFTRVNPYPVVAALTRAMQQLTERVEQLTERVEQLEARLDHG